MFDLESPELDAFTKSHVEILTLLASQAAVAIENARLYETIRANEIRLEKEIRFAQRVQAALLPTELPKRLKGVDVARALRAGARARRRPLRLSRARAEQPRRRGRRRVGQGRAGGALQRVRRRAGALAHVPPPLRARALQPGGRAGVDEHDPHERQLEEYTARCATRVFDFKRRTRDDGELRPAVSDSRCSGDVGRRRSSCRACRSDSFAGSTYDEVTFDLAAGDVFVFCTDGVFEANDALRPRVRRRAAARGRRARRGMQPAREIVDAIFDAVQEFRGDTPPNDDMTAVALKITQMKALKAEGSRSVIRVCSCPRVC